MGLFRCRILILLGVVVMAGFNILGLQVYRYDYSLSEDFLIRSCYVVSLFLRHENFTQSFGWKVICTVGVQLVFSVVF